MPIGRRRRISALCGRTLDSCSNGSPSGRPTASTPKSAPITRPRRRNGCAITWTPIASNVLSVATPSDASLCGRHLGFVLGDALFDQRQVGLCPFDGLPQTVLKRNLGGELNLFAGLVRG